MRADTLKNEKYNNQENDFIDAVKGTLISGSIFFVIFVIAIVIDFMR